MKKVLITMLMAIVIVSMCFVTSRAEASIKVNVNLDKTTVKAGEVLTFTISTSDFVDIAGEGIFAVSGDLVYDRDIFEPITLSDITGLNGWTSPQLNEDASMFYIDRTDFTSTPGEVAKIAFHVKSDAKTTSNVEIRFNNVKVVYDGGQTSPDLLVGDIVSSVNIEGTTLEEPDPDPTPTPDPDDNDTPGGDTTPDDNNIGNNNTPGGNTAGDDNNNNLPDININLPTNNNGTTGSNGNGNNNNNSNGSGVSSLPYTGLQGYIFPAILIIAVAGVIGYVKYRNME